MIGRSQDVPQDQQPWSGKGNTMPILLALDGHEASLTGPSQLEQALHADADLTPATDLRLDPHFRPFALPAHGGAPRSIALRAAVTRRGFPKLQHSGLRWWPDPRIHPFATSCGEFYCAGPVGHVTDVRAAYSELGDGAGTNVAVLDSGFVHGHGAMTTYDIEAVAPQANICPFDLSSSAGGSVYVRVSHACEAMLRVIELRESSGLPTVASCSWGIYDPSDCLTYAKWPKTHPFASVLLAAMNAGVVVLFSAGNCGECCGHLECNHYIGPGNSIWGANSLEQVITVAACTLPEDGHPSQVLGGSSQGPTWDGRYKPDICAYSQFAGRLNVDGGTSAACAVAAAVSALLLSRQPQAGHQDIKRHFIATARHVTATAQGVWDPADGYGVLTSTPI
jgi:Subtilase family